MGLPFGQVSAAAKVSLETEKGASPLKSKVGATRLARGEAVVKTERREETQKKPWKPIDSMLNDVMRRVVCPWSSAVRDQ